MTRTVSGHDTQRPASQGHDQLRATHVVGEERGEGTRRITHQGRALQYHAIVARPVKKVESPPVVYAPRRRVKPMPAHPWQKRFLPERRKSAMAPRT